MASQQNEETSSIFHFENVNAHFWNDSILFQISMGSKVLTADFVFHLCFNGFFIACVLPLFVRNAKKKKTNSAAIRDNQYLNTEYPNI